MAVRVITTNIINWIIGIYTPPAMFVETGLQMRR